MIYKEPPELGEIRDCWITRVDNTYTCYASSYKPERDDDGTATHCKAAHEDGVGSGYHGRWNPWQHNETWGLGCGVNEEYKEKQPLPYLENIENEESIKTQAIYLGDWKWRIL